jgi:hypothetical protein
VPDCPRQDGEPIPTTQLDPDQADQRARIEQAFQAAGQRAADGQAARAAALAEIGELLRIDAATGPRPLVGIVDAQDLTKLTRPTLTKARAGDHWAELRDLARDVLAYGDDQDARIELHARLPHLGGWWAAAEHLLTLHTDAYWDARGGFDPWSQDNPGTPAGYDELMAIYDGQVRAYADGVPPALARVGQTQPA